ncbi:hypothetical protein FOVSG1_009024 [Fusarium oxysporum f. sp. vasinfectum]
MEAEPSGVRLLNDIKLCHHRLYSISTHPTENRLNTTDDAHDRIGRDIMMLCAAHPTPILASSHPLSSSPLPSPRSSSHISLSLPFLPSARRSLLIQHSPCHELPQLFYTQTESLLAHLLDSYRILNPLALLRRSQKPKPLLDPPNLNRSRLLCDSPGLPTP